MMHSKRTQRTKRTKRIQRTHRAVVLSVLLVLSVLPSEAGDILRGGAPTNQRNPALNNSATSTAADAARTNASDALRRTTQALDAVRNMQNAARNLAGKGINGVNVLKPGLTPIQDGLHPNGLNFSKVVSGATAPTQVVADGRATVTVKQTAQQAFLEWNRFNIGRGTTLYFDQSAGKANAGQWIAFNQVKDPSGEPSQIMGQIKAQGQVYVINANGIIFGGTSQVNVHGLVASSLPINKNLLERGLLNNPKAEFLFSGLKQAAAAGGDSPFGPEFSYLPSGKIGDVEVQAGAQLTAPTNADHVGGRITLIGANVTNAGTIYTPDGQTILAAGLEVGLAAHSSKDPSLRGLDAFVGAVGDYAGTVTNTGLIDAPRGNITMTGKTVNQLGVLTASTSVSFNGRLDLRASYDAESNPGYNPANPDSKAFLYKSTGTVTLGPNSVMRILPELTSTDKVVGTKLALPSQINIEGKIIHFDHDAMLLAPNADITMRAGNWNFTPSLSNPTSIFTYNGGQVYLDKNVLIDVAGTSGSEAQLTDNIVTLQLRGAEFSNSPLNRNNPNVRGVDVTLDLRQQGVYNGFAWAGTPLADATGYVGVIQRDVGQLTGAGGTVKINAGNSVVMQQGSLIDVSGGYTTYIGGMVQTTRVTFRGNIFDISQATPDRVYDGIYTGKFTETSSRWGVSKTYTAPFMLGQHFEHSYTYGHSGGSINISAPQMALDGSMRGNTVNGPRQRDLQATPSALSLAFESQKITPSGIFTVSSTPPTVIFQNGVTQQAANAFNANVLTLREDRVKTVMLAPDALKQGGFGSVNVSNKDGKIILPAGETLDLGPRGSLTLAGANIDVNGTIISPSGSINLSALNISPEVVQEIGASATPSTPSANPNRGIINIGSAATITTAGLIVDDRLSAPDPFTLPLAINGGSISINAFTANLAAGSLIDVSGGVRVDPFGKSTYGDAGSITVAAGKDLSFAAVTGGDLTLAGTLRGIAGMGARGGSLSLQAQLVQIGGITTNADVLLLQPDFFNQGGFSSFSLTGIGSPTTAGLVIAPGTIIDPVVHNTVAVLYGEERDTAEMRDVVLPQGMRYPLSLSFNALGISDPNAAVRLIARGDVVMGEGAVIHAGPQGSVSFKGETVKMLGSVFAPGGLINLKGAGKMPSENPDPADAFATVYIGRHATLSTAGTLVLTPDAFGRRTGFVLPGGRIDISGNIVAEAGALLDVSGTSGELDVAPAYLGLTTTGDYLSGSRVVPTSSGLTTPLYSIAVERTRLDSAGGSISLHGSQMLFSHATLLGNAGGPTAAGGTLSISSSRFYTVNDVEKPSDINLIVSQTGSNLPGTFFAPGVDPFATAVGGGQAVTPAMGYFAANDFARGGFDSLSLAGNVQFKGPVTVDAKGAIVVATGGFIAADAAVNLTAKYVALGTPFAAPLLPTQVQNPFLFNNAPYFFAPTFGTGSLTVKADLIDIGNLTLTGIGNASLNATSDIRGNGTFSMAGDLFMRAAQIYPTTGSAFTIAAYDSPGHEGSITFARNGTVSLPRSAVGTLNVYATTINQGGVLRAPFGVINLGWDGTGTAPSNLVVGNTLALPTTKQLTLGADSVTSVSAIDPITGAGILIPYGTSPNGANWIDPAGADITASGLPNKAINLAGKSLTTETGSVIDLRGGGDAYAFRWVTGQTGTVDILASPNIFAVIPNYSADFAPFGAFNTSPLATNLNGEAGYVNGKLHPGDRIYLDNGSGLNAGYYTLLPARYATMPGAYLVTPQTSAPIGTFLKPDGASFVNGYRVSSYDGAADPTLWGRFEVAPATTVAQRAQYDLFFANGFFNDYATKHNLTVPRAPMDSGQLVLQATTAMTLNGQVLAASLGGGRGGLVDISSPVDIIIARPDLVVSGALVLDATKLSSFGAESLLIGGVRTVGPNGTTVTVKTNNLTLANDQSSALTGPEIILVANQSLNVDPGSVLTQSGALSGKADTLLFGNTTPGSGSGVMLRVSADVNAQIVRTNIAGGSNLPSMSLGTGSTISGTSVIVDSTYATNLVLGAAITGRAVSLNSGQISIELGAPSAKTTTNTVGLILTTSDLQRFQTSESLSLLSYSSIDIYGTGSIGDTTVRNLALHAGEIRGFDQGTGTVSFFAQNITLDNSANATAPGVIITPPTGTLKFDAETIHIGVNNTRIDQYANLELNASKGLFLDGTGSLRMAGSITANTPFITAARSATQSIIATGALNINSPGGSIAVDGGLGASLTLQGASATVNSAILLPSGRLSVIATGGDVNIGGNLDVGGTAQTFFDLIKYTDAGSIQLSSTTGNVNVTGTLNLAAHTDGGNAGTLSVNASQGSFTLPGTLLGKGGTGGRNGSFALDVKTLPALSAFNDKLITAGFIEAQTFRVRTGDVLIDGTNKAHSFRLSADAGKIDVSGTIDASGTTGGSINLIASKGMNLLSGALLDARGTDYDNAGKGGAITLETRGNSSGRITIASGSSIELGVAATAQLGEFGGTLHLRAPQNALATDVEIDTIGGNINGASSIIVEGFKTYALSGTGVINTALRNSIQSNGNTLGSNASAIATRILAGNTALSVQVGAELISTGDITLSSAWDLSGFRFGTKNTPGVLTMRATGNLVFNDTLSDGFTSAAYDATLLGLNTQLSANAQAWSYRLTAGADLTAVDFRQTNTLATGSLLLGRNAGDANEISGNSGPNGKTAAAVSGFFHVIRTGSGSIDINTGNDVRLLNQFATIYTAGTRVADPTMGGQFDLPNTNLGLSNGVHGALGTKQQAAGYEAQFAMAGGNVSINAGNDIAHYTLGNVDDSSRQTPNNWLYRRGYVIDPATGAFGVAQPGDVASTAWWVDYSNFFEGIGTLGGGNITLSARNDVKNIDAVIPTNARMSKDGNTFVELGGGDLKITTGRDLNAGVYYVERGKGTLTVAGKIDTNSTRSPSLTNLDDTAPLSKETWLPTTLFAGKSSFDINARGNVLMGPVANAFLMPQGFSNTYWYKSYFSTYSTDAAVNISSLSGSVTLRESVTLPTGGQEPAAARPLLSVWLEKAQLLSANSAANYHPWLRLAEDSITPFDTAVSIMPGTLRVTSFGGDINVIGNLTLSPSPTGTLDLAARGAVNGLQINGVFQRGTAVTKTWGTSRINLSDADPTAIFGIRTPSAYQATVGTTKNRAQTTDANDLLGMTLINSLFAESGSTEGSFGSVQSKLALHAKDLLHLNDTQPLHIYATDGGISGLTLFSGKASRVVASDDITDIALYLQNNRADDVSIVASGGDIIAYNASSPLRNQTVQPGNEIIPTDGPLAGDIQISGPGTLEVLAGRNLDLGVGGNRADGTGVGITSIGNGRNPSLPFEGANIIAAAGIGPAYNLSSSALDFESFVNSLGTGTSVGGHDYFAELADPKVTSLADYKLLSDEEQKRIALSLFFLVLRDAGRDHNLVGSPGFGNYAAGQAAVTTLFSGSAWAGDITTQARDIRTKSGGGITLLAPGGGLTLAESVIGTPLAPPGIITEGGGSINIFTNTDVNIGISRIFTLRGGDEVIWSNTGNIAAGSSSKTVQSAPPTRVIIDPQSGDVKTDLAGLATGGGIGVLATVAGVPPGSVDLIAPLGAIDAGDAGIRATGNLNIAAVTVLNASNISVGGATAGAPAAPAAAPTVSVSTPAPNPTQGNDVAKQQADQERKKAVDQQQRNAEDLPSIVTVEVIGYGGGDEEDEELKKKRKVQ